MPEAGGNINPLTPGAISPPPPPCIDNYMLPLMVNISVALCTYTAELFMYIVSMIGMEGEIQFVCFIVYNNKHINCFSLLIEGKDPVRCRYIYMVAENKKSPKM